MHHKRNQVRVNLKRFDGCWGRQWYFWFSEHFWNTL